MMRAVSRARLEAFSDGVIAIAITLLVLDIHVPGAQARGGLAAALAREWPSYLSYATSFLTIGIIWINHHLAIARLRAVNHGVLFRNLVLLLFVGLLPFTTALMADYLSRSSGERLAAAIYGGSLLAMGLSFASLQSYTLRRRPDLLYQDITPQLRASIFRRSAAGVLPYLLATALAAVSSYATLGVCAAVAVYYAMPSSGQPPASRTDAGGEPGG